MTDRVPPHSEEAEKGLIGSILLDADIVLFSCNESGVSDSWFYVPSHRKIFEAITEIRSKRRYVDILTVTDYLKQLGLIDAIGGPIALNRIIEATPTSAHASHYIGILRDAWMRRTSIEKARMLERGAMEPDADINDCLAKSITGLSLVASDRKFATTESLIKAHQDMRAKAKQGEQVGWQTPWEDVNDLVYGFREPHNVVIAAQTSTGKTALSANLAMHFIEKGARVAISENDMSRADLEKRIVGMMTGINPLIFMTEHFTEEQERIWDDAWRKLGEMPLYINDDRMTMEETEAWALSEKARHGIDIFFFDFLQKVKRTKDEWRHSLREVVGDWSCRTCEIGKRMKAATVTISQFARSGNKDKDVTPAHPTLENLKETGEIENNADVVMLLSKKPGQPVSLYTGKHPVWDIDLDIAKHRNGPTGIVEMSLLIRTQRFVTRTQGDIEREEIEMEREKQKRKLNNQLTEEEDND